jgi:hypothetical protein
MDNSKIKCLIMVEGVGIMQRVTVEEGKSLNFKKIMQKEVFS